MNYRSNYVWIVGALACSAVPACSDDPVTPGTSSDGGSAGSAKGGKNSGGTQPQAGKSSGGSKAGGSAGEENGDGGAEPTAGSNNHAGNGGTQSEAGTDAGGTQSEGGSGGAAGTATAGSAGAAGTATAGAAGTAGSAGAAGTAGGGSAGAAGTAGAGTAGSGGAAGNAGSGGSSAGTAGSSGSAGSGGTGGGSETMWYDFETDAQGWTSPVTIGASADRAVHGSKSLKISMPALTNDNRLITIPSPQLWPGDVVTLHVWSPLGVDGLYVQGYSQTSKWDTDGNAGNSTVLGDWMTFTYTVPQTALPGGISNFGLQIGASSFAGGDFYLDALTVTRSPNGCSGSGTGSYQWETAASSDGWGEDSTVLAISQSTEQAKAGTGSLKVAITAMPAGGDAIVQLYGPNLYCGQTITYNIWTPLNSSINVNLFVQSGGWQWSGEYKELTTRGGWTTVTRPAPDITPQGVQAMGIQFLNQDTTAFTGDVYVDAVSWP